MEKGVERIGVYAVGFADCIHPKPLSYENSLIHRFTQH
jgi:hypothetical protein